MNVKRKYKFETILKQSLKIMIGSSMAIFIAMLLNLEFATSAGIVALLTIETTKLETIKLSIYRVATYVVTVILSWIMFQHISSIWIAYGVFVFIIIFLAEWVGWKATISVNVVIGTHYLSTLDFSIQFMLNELMLVLIGISIAIVLNLFTRNTNEEKRILQNIIYTETKMKDILDELEQYLRCEHMERNVWLDTGSLEREIEYFIKLSYEYSNNTFKKESNYYGHYFEMRMMQVGVLHNLHSEMRKIRYMPEEAKIVADYIMFIRNYILELNNPRKQIEELEHTFGEVLKGELPLTVEEFEGRAILYHILMDLEEFLMYKMRFVELNSNVVEKRSNKKNEVTSGF